MYNPNLEAHIRRFLSQEGTVPDELKPFLNVVNEVYSQLDYQLTQRMDKGYPTGASAELEQRLRLQNAELARLRAELQARTLELERTKHEAEVMRRSCLDAEKAAAIARPLAGIVHELNNPLGVIHASSTTANNQLPTAIHKLLELCADLTPELLQCFRQLLTVCLKGNLGLSTREERVATKEVSDYLEARQIPMPRQLSVLLVKAGVTDNLSAILPLLRHENSRLFIDSALAIGRLKSNIENINESSNRANKIVLALKNAAPVRPEDDYGFIFLPESVRNALILTHNATKYAVQVNVDVADEVPPVTGRGSELQVVWLNIIRNAVQAMEGRGSLRIRIWRQARTVFVSFTDSGPGIPPEILPRIFDPFFTTRRKGGEGGMGLPLCREIVEKHGGNIWVDTQPGRTTFLVGLPANDE